MSNDILYYKHAITGRGTKEKTGKHSFHFTVCYFVILHSFQAVQFCNVPFILCIPGIIHIISRQTHSYYIFFCFSVSLVEFFIDKNRITKSCAVFTQGFGRLCSHNQPWAILARIKLENHLQIPLPKCQQNCEPVTLPPVTSVNVSSVCPSRRPTQSFTHPFPQQSMESDWHKPTLTTGCGRRLYLSHNSK